MVGEDNYHQVIAVVAMVVAAAAVEGLEPHAIQSIEVISCHHCRSKMINVIKSKIGAHLPYYDLCVLTALS